MQNLHILHMWNDTYLWRKRSTATGVMSRVVIKMPGFHDVLLSFAGKAFRGLKNRIFCGSVMQLPLP